jgi:hypothetical protein
MNSVATPVTVNPRDWGTLGTLLNENTLEHILGLTGHSSIRCINKNGRALANKWLKEERDDHARAVKGSKENWTAYKVICFMVDKNVDSLNPNLPITVRGDCEVLIEMMRAAFGRFVLGGTTRNDMGLCSDMMDGTYDAYDSEDDFHPFLRNSYSHVIMCQDALIYLGAVGVVTHINDVIGKQPILEWNSPDGLLTIKPIYGLMDNMQFNIGAISQSMEPRIDNLDPETMIVRTICDVFNLYDNTILLNRAWESVGLFHTSLAKLLPTDNLDVVLNEDIMCYLIACGLFPWVVLYNNIIQRGVPPVFPVQIRKLWKDGPSFCLINDEATDTTSLFRTPHFPGNP